MKESKECGRGNSVHTHAISQKPRPVMKNSSYFGAEKAPSRKQEILPGKRQKIFGTINPKPKKTPDSDEETIVYPHRKYTYDGTENNDDLMYEPRRQSENQKKGSDKEEYCNTDGIKTYRKRNKIFSREKSCGKSKRKRVSWNAEQVQDVTKTERQNLKQSSLFSKQKMMEKQGRQMEFRGRSPAKHLTDVAIKPVGVYSGVSLSHIRDKVETPRIQRLTNQMFPASPSKITFTYKEKPKLMTPQSFSKKCSDQSSFQCRVERKTTDPSFTNFTSSVAPFYNNICQKKDNSDKSSKRLNKKQNTHHVYLEQKVKKGIFDNRNKKEKKVADKGEKPSWGTKIKKDLMTSSKDDKKVIKNQSYSCMSINGKQSRIFHGQKLDISHIKIMDSLNKELEQNKRYYDQQQQFLSQLKKVSYKNIDISRSQSLDDNNQQFKPNELFTYFPAHNENEDNYEPIVIKRVESKNSLEKIENAGKREDHILQKLVHSLDEQDEKEIKKEGKKKSMVERMLPLLLVVFATMLLLIQISI